MISTGVLALLMMFFMQAPATAANTPSIQNPWSKAKSPTAGPAESIGGPAAGCLRGAQKLERAGAGYLLMRSERGRAYGHPKLIQLLKDIGAKFQKNNEAPLFMGDVGQARGGPTMSAHASHQTGLDADIWYARPKRWNTKAPLKKKLQTPILHMVNTAKEKVNSNFGPEQIALLRKFAESESVDRILVHYAIKRELCDKIPKEEWIHKIRPWFGHDHHFHIRLKCATTDKLCIDGEPIEAGPGCGESLAWWWSAEAKEEARKNQAKQAAPVMPALPKECEAVKTAASPL